MASPATRHVATRTPQANIFISSFTLSWSCACSQGDSHEGAVARGRGEISSLVEHFRIFPSNDATEAAHRLYKLALQRGFTRGRRVNQVGMDRR